MIKHYCDICGKEIQNIEEATRICCKYNSDMYDDTRYSYEEVCKSCDLAIYICIKKLRDEVDNDK